MRLTLHLVTLCLFACAFIANAASFVLPISNPANLVVFHKDMPLLLRWLFLVRDSFAVFHPSYFRCTALDLSPKSACRNSGRGH